MDILKLLAAVPSLHASDLHLQVGSPPCFRVIGEMMPADMPPISSPDMRQLLAPVLDDPRRTRLEANRSVDFAYALPAVARFRVNIYYEKAEWCAAFRIIPNAIPTIDELRLPSVIGEIALAPRGLVLVTGATGSGKSTTLAAMINAINAGWRKRIITLEDPIEFLHPSKKSLISQRELGPDVTGFSNGLREALRQNPDVILVGEMRDRETVETALQAADTGHTVFATLHTTTAAQTLQRLTAFFPADERPRILLDLAASLEAVICQRLAKTADNQSRVPVNEIMRTTPPIRKLLAEGNVLGIPKVIAGKEMGMRLFDQHLVELCRAEIIAGREAARLANNPEAVLLARKGIQSADLAASIG
ncbi:MAG: type IV pilus twitching motility protein PilT [Phycisphaerae bacterium]